METFPVPDLFDHQLTEDEKLILRWMINNAIRSMVHSEMLGVAREIARKLEIVL